MAETKIGENNMARKGNSENLYVNCTHTQTWITSTLLLSYAHPCALASAFGNESERQG